MNNTAATYRNVDLGDSVTIDGETSTVRSIKVYIDGSRVIKLNNGTELTFVV